MSRVARSLSGERQWGDDPDRLLLPPLLIQPGRRLKTPTDARGFVMIPETIRLVQSVVPRGHTWRPNLSVHHFYWPERDYAAAGDVATRFRELPIHKGLTLREFENALHRVTTSVPVPDEREMSYRIQAWEVAHDLFRSASQAVSWERRSRRRQALIARKPHVLPPEFRGEDVIGREVLAEILDRHSSGIEQHLERAAEIPEEHQLFDPNADKEELATRLGELVVPGALYLMRAVAA